MAGKTGDHLIVGPFEEVGMLLTSPRDAMERISNRSPLRAAMYRPSCEGTACWEAVDFC